jgi:hypothetical protein
MQRDSKDEKTAVGTLETLKLDAKMKARPPPTPV